MFISSTTSESSGRFFPAEKTEPCRVDEVQVAKETRNNHPWVHPFGCVADDCEKAVAWVPFLKSYHPCPLAERMDHPEMVNSTEFNMETTEFSIGSLPPDQSLLGMVQVVKLLDRSLA